MKELILSMIEELKEEQYSIGDIYEDFDPSDGSNYDDAYHMGVNHGEVYGKLEVLRELLKNLD